MRLIVLFASCVRVLVLLMPVDCTRVRESEMRANEVSISSRTQSVSLLLLLLLCSGPMRVCLYVHVFANCYDSQLFCGCCALNALFACLLPLLRWSTRHYCCCCCRCCCSHHVRQSFARFISGSSGRIGGRERRCCTAAAGADDHSRQSCS